MITIFITSQLSDTLIKCAFVWIICQYITMLNNHSFLVSKGRYDLYVIIRILSLKYLHNNI